MRSQNILLCEQHSLQADLKKEKRKTTFKYNIKHIIAWLLQVVITQLQSFEKSSKYCKPNKNQMQIAKGKQITE